MLHNLVSVKSKTHRRRGRGTGSGRGTYSGRGIKGQKARSGGATRPGFEGGRTPIIRLLPKQRGGHRFKRVRAEVRGINLALLEKTFAQGQVITLDLLRTRGLIHREANAKILGKGEITKALTIDRLPISEAAKAAIEKAGGTVILPVEATPEKADHGVRAE